MEEFLVVISQHYTPVVVVLGAIVCLAGVLRLLFSRSFAWAGLAVIFLGGVFAGIPMISKASFGTQGFEIVTNLNQATESLNSAVKANGDAIASLREGLAAVETLVRQAARQESGTSTAELQLSRDALEAIQRSLNEAESELLNIESATTRIDQQIKTNDALIRQLDR